MCGWAKFFLAPPYYNHRAVFASPLGAFSFLSCFFLEKFVDIDVSEAVHLPAARQRIFTCTVLSSVVNF